MLASNSPRRKELLALFGWPFEVIPADIDESQKTGESAVAYVRRLAREKAQAIAATQEGLVLAADTIVVDGAELLGKPVDDADARRMLIQLRGRTHQVYTGIALIETASGVRVETVCQTNVPMRNYSDTEIEAYIQTGDPLDKAGAYAIQHNGFHPVEKLEGCYASVMGLPLCHLTVALRRLGWQAPADLPERCQATLHYDCPVFKEILGLT
ncbi:MAG: septum formation inhibitor Maf [Anaerolineaceae bacterium]|nr:septum formation inhibitor Maf [Anaerolineaceae bacterium]